MNFEDVDWHDSIINKIEIDRSLPGKIDEIKIELTINDSTSPIVLIFEDVYWSLLNMNFGIVAMESVEYALILKDDPDLNALKDKWNDVIKDELHCYVIKTNSTASTLKIISKSVTIE